ncbi:unnamed protein product, partial [marine sediment metagenome]
DNRAEAWEDSLDAVVDNPLLDVNCFGCHHNTLGFFLFSHLYSYAATG